MENNEHKNTLYAGIVWIVSAIALAIYGTLTMLNAKVPGTEELIQFITNIEGKYIYLAAFVSVFIEGLYFIGNFFPGASLVLILAVLSEGGGLPVFLTTIFLIFIGWCLAGVVNIYVAKTYRSKIVKLEEREGYEVEDRVWTTWFPSFRASYEVAQVTEGGNPLRVFLSSLRVRIWASLFMGGIAYIIPLFFDISKTTDREGYISIIVVALISLAVGIVKLRDYYSKRMKIKF
jgi:hypothetical protein